ncbi:type I 3-dehydroquinate dehydratase [Virgibacillus profundi]|uniref:3-dehydroquinate dehydratase n=1 Tax=Virgibacillus profundi TaxID=2024555 RepID=A0A2A2I846_9BACI|nr:type I 3-dehydroquinate dehydratase [Virgibacillus profundi]PAV27752.1 type I 3-dehydroquinate dehydratase [Virgibacillus profundi]PXY51907.1 type I 3-dehydroquinate dehydratase [Virgibacillus profundi]
MNRIQIKNIKIGEGPPKVIVPLMGKNEIELMEEVKEVIILKPDIVEWRADVFDSVENLEVIKGILSLLREQLSEIPILFTFRSHREGGNKQVTDLYYHELLSTAIQSNLIDLIDIELFSQEENLKDLMQKAKDNNVYVIMSNHDFEKTPAKDEIIKRLRSMQDLGADIPKIAVMPTNISDVLTLLEATDIMRSNYADRPIITMAMGSLGVISRIGGEVFGSAATFGIGKQASAPGQIAVDDLRDVLNIIHKAQ